jgi:maltooligosyltrehalose trehalohydrolase
MLHRPPFGANVDGDSVEFRVWAPKARRVEVEIVGGAPTGRWPLTPLDDGVHAGRCAELGAGTRYRFRLDGGASYPDPWSRYQPEGVHGPSEVVDPAAFAWADAAWSGLDRRRLVIYELHVGTFTTDGTFDAVIGQLTALKRLGVTAIELMPVAEFPGRWNWGYDGVDLFAPSRNYGGPSGLKRLVAAAHRSGLGVLLDVVYSHLGPDGNYLRAYSEDYFTDRHTTPWGDAVNFDGPNSRRVREYVVQNALYWLREYHLDGFRLDAAHAIHDDGPVPVLQELAANVHRSSERERGPTLIAEDSRNDPRLIRRPPKGWGLDAVWADDFHHAVHTMLTGEREGYYADYAGTVDQLARTIAGGFLYQGQRSKVWGKPRGSPVADESASAFVFGVQNHDQVGNRALGERLSHLVGPGEYAVAVGLLLLSPETPLLFMGQEFAASAPFQYFTDHEPELGRLVTEGRRKEFAGFSAFQDPARRALIPDPQAEATFRRSKLDFTERRSHAGILRLHRALLALRRTDPVFAAAGRDRLRVDPLGARAVVLRYWSGDSPADQRLVVANFGPALDLPAGETLGLEALAEGSWRVLLSTASRRFGGDGSPSRLRAGRLQVPQATLVALAGG